MDFRFRRSMLAASVGVALSGAQASGRASPSSTAGSAEAGQQRAAVEEVVVTARFREERAQDVPIALTVIGADQLEGTGATSTLDATALAPSVQYITSNPRNTSITVRGFGSTFGLTNDGLEPGVGIYIDQVYHPRPSVSTFDLIDVERIEVLRGPQGTLYGKNTTAGALKVATRLPSFVPESNLELSAGKYGFLQAKASLSGPLSGDTLAGRVSVVGSRRDGTLWNVPTGDDINETNNHALNAQLLYEPSDDFRLRLIGEIHEHEVNCCTQVFVRVGETMRSPDRQFEALAAGIGYEPPSRNPYDRLADVNSGARADQKLGGLTVIADWDVAGGTLTSVSGWRFWDWRPGNDRDYTSLSILTASVNPSDQKQLSQEIRFASTLGDDVDYIAGLYAFKQTIETDGLQGYGADAAYWLIDPNANAPASLLDGYESLFRADSTVESYAVFAQADWHITDRLTFTPGMRYTRDTKDALYDQVASGGLESDDPALIALKQGIVRSQFYAVDYDDGSASGQLNLSYTLTDDLMVYGKYAQGYKSGGINLAGIPNDAAGNPSLINALVNPEEVENFEVGVKSRLFDRALTLNVALFDTQVEEYQANVVDVGPGALRGYLANIDEVGVRGVEMDVSWVAGDRWSGYVNAAFNDGEYVSFANAPCPLEQIGGPAFCDLSGSPLPGLPDTAVSLGAEYHKTASVAGYPGEMFFGADATYRSEWYSDASVSRYGLVDGYGLLNLRAGFRADNGWEVSAWMRNALDEEYLLFTSMQSGNSGLVLGQPGDPRTAGLTLRTRF